MLDYQPLYHALAENGAPQWAARLPQQIEQAYSESRHGDLSRWRHILSHLPCPETALRKLTGVAVKIGSSEDIEASEKEHLRNALAGLHPWRKGPYDIFDIHIDSEWRSDWKWQRLQGAISPLKNRVILDVGCGNGYHCWRMLGEGASMVLGIDPTLLSVMQFQAVRKLYGEAPVYVLPLGIEALPSAMRLFHSVFSMGVLYHRRSPLDHLLELRDCLQSGGELVLETLVIEGKKGELLLPEGRYAKMRNVWFIPTCETLLSWLKRCGFKDIRLVSVCKTSSLEQRSTEWMRFQSLADFLDPQDSSSTLEGLPAPVRAIFVASVY